MAQLDRPRPAPAELRRWIGPPLRQSFGPLLQHDPVLVESAVAHYRQRFEREGWREHAIYPGIETLIDRLHEAGHRLAVVTSKPRIHAAPILAHLTIGKRFESLYSADAESATSEKAAMIGQALADFGTDPSEVVMIGDRHFDIEGARANQVRGLGVLWGFGDREELEQAGAHALAATPVQLADMLLDGGRVG